MKSPAIRAFFVGVCQFAVIGVCYTLVLAANDADRKSIKNTKIYKDRMFCIKWIGKYILSDLNLPTKVRIFEHWMEWLNKRAFDWVEPSCWACKCHNGIEFDLKNPKATREEIINNWNRVPLQLKPTLIESVIM
jgi:hypothetical protein